MEAITYEVNLGTYFLGKAVGGVWPGLYHGPLSGLRHRRDWPAPTRRGDDWALVRVTHAGVCGSDIAAVHYKSSPALTPFTSFPSVLGHEILGVVEEAGPAVDHVKVGDRVAVEPFLTCATRGIAVACEACRGGHYCVCHHTADGEMAPGMIMGACRDHGGGWGERVAAHRSQLFRVPDELSDTEGVLVEPVSIGMHAVLRRVPEAGSRVLVIGSGMMAFAAIAALKMLRVACEITHLTHLPYQKAAGLALGVTHAICHAEGDDPTTRVKQITGARGYRPILGREVLVGGFDQVYDCVGTDTSLQDAMYFTRPRGTIVLVGAPGELPGLDWSFVWSRELTLMGTLGYGVEDLNGERIRTFDLTMRLMLERRVPLEPLVTHTFALAQVTQALEANLDRAGSRSIKTVFTPGKEMRA